MAMLTDSPSNFGTWMSVNERLDKEKEARIYINKPATLVPSVLLISRSETSSRVHWYSIANGDPGNSLSYDGAGGSEAYPMASCAVERI